MTVRNVHENYMINELEHNLTKTKWIIISHHNRITISSTVQFHPRAREITLIKFVATMCCVWHTNLEMEISEISEKFIALAAQWFNKE